MLDGGWRPSASQEVNATSSVPVIVVPRALAVPVPVAVQFGDPGTPTGAAARISESRTPSSVPLTVPENVMSVTAGDVNSVAGPATFVLV